MKKQFDATKPHNHECPHCWKLVYCRGVNCEIPERAECLECRAGWEVERFANANNPHVYSGGHRKTWPGRDRESY
jgi:hypothetical protein